MPTIFAGFKELDALAQKLARKNANGREVGYAFWDIITNKNGQYLFRIEYSKDWVTEKGPTPFGHIPNASCSWTLDELGLGYIQFADSRHVKYTPVWVYNPFMPEKKLYSNFLHTC